MARNDYTKETVWTVPNPTNLPRWLNHPVTQIVREVSGVLGGTVADFGCNNGISIAALSAIPTVQEVIGFDICSIALESVPDVVRAYPASRVEIVETRECNFLDIDADDNSIDGAICFHALEHIYPDDLNPVLAEFARVLKQNAPLVFSVPMYDAFGDAESHVSQFSIEARKGYINLPDLLGQLFSVHKINVDVRLLNQGGLCITGIATVK